MSVKDDKKPDIVIEFSPAETAENTKTIQLIIRNFIAQHPELGTIGNIDSMTRMMREEKMMFSQLAIKYTVEYIAAMKKKGLS